MRFSSILIVLTEVCHVGCRHCGYIGARRDREVESQELEGWIDQIVAYGIPEIIFTGGEAFERYTILQRGVCRAREGGLRISVFTSSFWATSGEEAERILRGVNGVTKLYLSTDVYHQKRIPYQYVRNAIDAALAIGITDININITFATEADRAYVAAQYSDYGDRLRIYEERVIPSPKFSPRVLSGQDPLRDLTPANYSSKCWLGTPLVDPQGDVFACHIGKAAAHKDFDKRPYFLGNLRHQSFAEIMGRSQARADYQFLRTHGPRGVAEMAQRNPALTRSMPRCEFTTACDMCVCVLASEQGAESLIQHAIEHKLGIDARLALMLGEEPVVAASPSPALGNSHPNGDQR